MTKPKPNKRGRSPVDLYISTRVREARHALGITQTELAEEIGVTFQQIQKYENGTNRISSGRLADLSVILHRKIVWFFPSEYR